MEIAAIGNGRGELRRLHIVYFLSRVGHVEHPHLIRVHHLTRNGVYLRDVKRWLAEVRGKDMPKAFSWSYKRRYKSGYVWQDLMDDDLITPISDNEYILKGSESIPHATFDPSINGKKKIPVSKNDQQPIEVEEQHQGQLKEQSQGQSDPKAETPQTPETSPEIFEESTLFGSDRSSSTDDSMKQHENDTETVKQNTNEQIQRSENRSSPASFSSSLLNKTKIKNKKTKESIDNDDRNKINNNDMEKTDTPADLSFSSSSSSKSKFAKGKSYSNGASNILRNLIKCGPVVANDAVLVPVNRADKNCLAKSVNIQDRSAAICRGDKLGGSARIFGTQWNNQHQPQNRARKSFDGVTGSKRKNEFASTRPVSSAHKPVGGPTCWQCGKPFKPEKMHKHMKSCKGMKTLAKTAAVSVAKTPPQRSVNLSPPASTSRYLLLN